jgi:hypothetical protein
MKATSYSILMCLWHRPTAYSFESQRTRAGVCSQVSPDSGKELVRRSCEHGNEPSASIKDDEFLDQLSDC